MVKGRALPDVCDGQKPVQRRILYAMNEMGLGPTAKPVKSARVVGDVLGKYHPHGDTAAYDALVRMAQSFTLRYPLIDGQGNFGSRDGDGAAAMRYTEARLTPHRRLLLDEIDEGTVDFAPNYDGSAEEPALLPARLPMVLLNGASGIAVGMATEIPPHNLREVAAAAVALIRESEDRRRRAAGADAGPGLPRRRPDHFARRPTSREIYASGRGSLKARARYAFEDLARGQWQLVVTELPHGVSTQKVLEEIEELTNPKVQDRARSRSRPSSCSCRQSCSRCSTRCATSRARTRRCAWCSSRRPRGSTSRSCCNVLLAHTSLETERADQPGDDRPRRPAAPEVAARRSCRSGPSSASRTVTRRSEHRLAQGRTTASTSSKAGSWCC